MKKKIIFDCGMIFFSFDKSQIENYDVKFRYWYTDGNFSKFLNTLFDGIQMYKDETFNITIDSTAFGYERNFCEDFPNQLSIIRVSHISELSELGSNSFIYKKVYYLSEY